MSKYGDYIVSDPDVMLGKPVIKGTRITVEIILKKLSEGATIPELLETYPHIGKKGIYAALEYAYTIISKKATLSRPIRLRRGVKPTATEIESAIAKRRHK